MYDWYHATAIPSSLGPVKSRMVCLSGARNSHGDSKFIYCPCVLWMKYNVVDIIYVYCQLNSLYCYWKASEFDKKTVEIRFNSVGWSSMLVYFNEQREENSGDLLAEHCRDVGWHLIKHGWQSTLIIHNIINANSHFIYVLLRPSTQFASWAGQF